MVEKRSGNDFGGATMAIDSGVGKEIGEVKADMPSMNRGSRHKL